MDTQRWSIPSATGGLSTKSNMKRPFDGDRFIHAEIIRLCAKHRVEIAVETGTQYGVTARALSEIVDRVYTVDIYDKFVALTQVPNIFAFQGNSPEVLDQIILPDVISRTTKPVLFYLDAHGNGKSPILEELATIAKHKILLPVIAIHDFKVDWMGYDTYDGVDLGMEMVAPGLKEIYQGLGFDFHTNRKDRSEGPMRGILYVEGE